MATNSNNYIINIFAKGAKAAQTKLGKLNNELLSMAGKVAGVAAIAAAIGKIASEAAKMPFVAARAEGLGKAFDSLSKNAGLSANAMKTLKEATDGTVGSIELMEQANKAMTLGIVTSEEQMGEMFDIAQRLGKAMGLDVTQSLDSLTTGLGRQSALMLDNLGIMVDTEQAYKDYAKEINKATSELTDQEKKTAFLNAAMDQAKDKADSLGEEQLDLNDAMKQLSTVGEELSIVIGKKLNEKLGFLVPLLKNGAEALVDFLTPPDLQTMEGLNKHLKDLNAELEKEQKLLNGLQSDAIRKQEIKLIKEQIDFTEKEIEKRRARLEQLDDEQAKLENLFASQSEPLENLRKITDDYFNKQVEGFQKVKVATMEQIDVVNILKLELESLSESYKENSMTVIDSFSSATSALRQNLQSREQNELNSLRKSDSFRKASNEKRADMERDLQAKFAKEKLRLWRFDKASQLAQAGINVAEGITKALPNVILAGIVGALGAVQIGAIAGTKPPQFQYGGMVGGRRHSQGGTMIEAEQGEFVMSRDAVSRIGVNNLNAMNQGASGTTINISAPLLDDTIVDSIIPKIEEAVRRGSDLGV
tara:strand:+ start:7037 stop:8809 length:1773 start_codon:yes stop_codon:yes gene_type:complete